MMEIHRFLDPVLQRKSFERFKITAESAKKGISTTYNSTVDDFSFSKDLVLHLLAAQINHLIFKKRGTFLIGKRIFLIKTGGTGILLLISKAAMQLWRSSNISTVVLGLRCFPLERKECEVSGIR